MNLLQATAIATLLAAIPLLAQSQEHQQATPQPRLSSPGMTMSPGMMQGMMGSGGMMTQGMMGQGSPGLGSGSRQRWSGFGNMPIDRVEGRLAFLKTELRISDAQLPAWNAFAEAVRTNATTQHAERQFMHGRVGADVPLPDRVAAQGQRVCGARRGDGEAQGRARSALRQPQRRAEEDGGRDRLQPDGRADRADVIPAGGRRPAS